MREIKFRAWDKKAKRLLYFGSFPQCIDGDNCGHIWLNTIGYKEYTMKGTYDSSDIKENAENLILMQYTGLKDKNGKEVYEGDIIECTTCHNEDEQTAEVEFFEGAFVVDLGCDIFISALYAFRIIGNIHENPELMEGE